MKIDSQTKLYGVFGNPVGHSLSPLIHNAAFQALGINAVYTAFQINKQSLSLAFEGIRSLSLAGVNLTIPFKEEAIELIDEIPEDVDRAMGALNTVVNKEGILYGYNTDGPGFLMALKESLSFNPEGKNMLLLGAGGAACGVVFSLAHARAEQIFILNRTHDRAQHLAEFAQTHFPETEICAVREEDIKNHKIDLVVNATSCGMESSHSKSSHSTPFDLKQLHRPTAVYDLVYSPLETPLLKTAKSLGFKASNGLSMLVAQAALAFELWTGKKEGVREAMREALKTCHS